MNSITYRCLALAALGLVIACGNKYEPKTPEMPEVKVPEFRPEGGGVVCSRSESEQPTPSALNNKITAEDTIKNIELEFIDCEGKVTNKMPGPERGLNASVGLPAPSNLSEEVQYVSIENSRTCVTHVFDAHDDLDKATLQPQSMADRSGKANIELTDSFLKVPFDLNVQEGLNVLKVKYFGKCEKAKAAKIPDTEDSSHVNCEVGREIGSQDVILDVKVNRPEGTGKKIVKICDENPK